MPKRWDDMSPAQKVMVAVLVSVQISLAVTAWTDLARRPVDQVRGPKKLWTAVIGINFIGPLSYFKFGRRRPEPPAPEPAVSPA